MSKLKEYLKENWAVLAVFAVLSVLEVAVIFPLMYEDYINYDSSYQYALTQHSIPEIIELLPYDYSPPFYALALKLYTMVFGNTLTVMRSFSIFAVVGMLFVGAFPVKTLFGKQSSVLCMVITFCSGAMFRTLHEIRPTLFAMFFLMAAAVYAVGAYSLEKRYMYVCFTVFAVLSMYTHNIALVSVFSVYIVLLTACLLKKDYRKLRRFFVSGLICAVLYIPWLGVIFSQISSVNDHFWETQTSLSTILDWTFYDSFKPYSEIGWASQIKNTLVLIVMLGLFFVFLNHIKLKAVKNAKKFKEVIKLPAEKIVYFNIFLIFAFLFGSILIMQLVNIFLRNISAYRYYFIIGTLWIVMLAAILGQLGGKKYNMFFIASLLAFNVINICLLKDDLNNSNFLKANAYIEKNSHGDRVCFYHSHEWSLGTMAYYFPDALHIVSDSTFTVLRTYDVFTAEVVDIGSIDNIWDYTDKCYFVLSTNLLDLEESVLFDDCEVVPIGDYTMGYFCVSKNYSMSEVIYTNNNS